MPSRPQTLEVDTGVVADIACVVSGNAAVVDVVHEYHEVEPA